MSASETRAAEAEVPPSPAKAAEVVPAGPDLGGILAYVVFVAIGGLLVFGFAWSLLPAAEAHRGAACRPLDPLPTSKTAPLAPLQTLSGEPVQLDTLKGKFVVLNFWATWCEPCTREWPDLDKLAARFTERDDVVVVAVSVDKELGDIAPYLERMGLSNTEVTIWWDPSGEHNKAFGSEKIPDTFFVDRSGEVVSTFINVRKWGKPDAYRCVDTMASRN